MLIAQGLKKVCGFLDHVLARDLTLDRGVFLAQSMSLSHLQVTIDPENRACLYR